MKAIIVREYGPPDVMKLEDVEGPEPSRSQVLVKIKAAGVNPVDTYLRSGIYPNPPTLPYTPGKDGAGIVEVVGSEVSKFKNGDRVYTAGSISGTYAEFSLCEDSQLGTLPANVGFDEGAGIWTPYATSFRALFQKAYAMAGETVLIHGASGGVGLAAVQWAKSAGMRVIGTASSDAGKELVKTHGADAVFDHTNVDHYGEIFEFTGGYGVDVVIEMLANENLERDFECIAKFGRIVVVGSRGSLEFTPRLPMTKDVSIYGMSLFNAVSSELVEIHSAIRNGLEAGSLKPIVGKRFPIEDAAASHHEVIESKAAGKIVLII